jgi:hypothetical protein
LASRPAANGGFRDRSYGADPDQQVDLQNEVGRRQKRAGGSWEQPRRNRPR